MASFFGFNFDIPSLGIGSGKIIWVVILFIVAIIIAIVTFIIFQYRTYNKKVIVFENISGQGFQPVLRDRARLVKLGDAGEEVLFLKKKRVYRTAYGRKMGKNTYWFAIGQDGYWYNVVLSDLDAKMGSLDIDPIDRDMRYMHVAIRKNIQDRYRKVSFMDKYGTHIMLGIFLLIMILGLYFLLDKMTEISATTAQAVQVSLEVQSATQQTLSALENICGASGLK